MSRAKRTRKARMAARQERRLKASIERVHGFMTDLKERARFRADLNASDLPAGTKTVLGLLADPLWFVTDVAIKEFERQQCPHCASNGIRATLERVVTARGDVDRCWQCGGEYRDGKLVWPIPKEVS